MLRFPFTFSLFSKCASTYQFLLFYSSAQAELRPEGAAEVHRSKVNQPRASKGEMENKIKQCCLKMQNSLKLKVEMSETDV